MNSASIITIIIVALIFAAVLFPLIKGMFSKQTCCGTEKVKAVRKRLKNRAGKRIFRIEGIKCEHCRKTIENALNTLDGIAARAAIGNRTVTVYYEDVLDEKMIADIIEANGFELSEAVSSR